MSKYNVLFMVFLLLTGISAFPAHSASNKFSFQQPKAKEDTSKKVSLLRKLSEAIKFRDKAISNEEIRVQKIIKKMTTKDSTIATVKDLEKLKKDISESNKRQSDTLLKLIKEIRITEKKTPANEDSPAGNHVKPFKVEKELDPNDKYINDLIDRLIPILTDTKEDEDKVKSRQEKLSLIRAIFAKKNTFVDKISDSTAIRYRLKLSHRAQVFGNHQYQAGYNSNQYNLSTLTGLLYNSYDLDGTTGFAKNFNAWNDAPVIASAKDAHAKVFLTVTTSSSKEMARFLINPVAMKTMINKTLELLEQQQADGINIKVSGLNQRLRTYFVDFIAQLSKAYRAKSKQYKISINLPVYDILKVYDIASLDPLVDNFIIDFSKKPTKFPGPIAPLNDNSDYDIESSVSRYLNAGIPPYKFILCLSYYGVEFKKGQDVSAEKLNYIAYHTIRLNAQYSPVTYNKEQAYASIETRDDDGNLTGHIYYDNETSLEQKYDFIIQNGLGGVAIWELGADEGYGELWDALASKFIKIDTVSTEKISLKRSSTGDGSVWGFIKTNTTTYFYALQDPCNAAYKPNETLLTVLNIFLAVVCLSIIIILISQIKAKGEKWKWRKPLMRTLFVCFNLFIITIFMWLYIDTRITWFGSGVDCIRMPFIVLLLIIITGIGLGLIIMKYLIAPALQNDEKP